MDIVCRFYIYTNTPFYIILYLVFDHEPIFKNKMNQYLLRRQAIKLELEKPLSKNALNSLNIQSSLIKLLVNSVYGYCLLEQASNKYQCFVIKSKQSLKNLSGKLVKKYEPTSFCLPGTTKWFIVGLKNVYKNSGFISKRILPEIGSLILQASKVHLLKCLYFILSHTCPTKCQFLYCDTDSIHLSLSQSTLR